MKKIKLMILTGMLTGVLSAQAAVVYFGAPDATATNWNDTTNMSTVDNGDGSYTYTKVQDGVTFTLTLQGYTNYTGTAGVAGITPFGNGAGLGVTGGTSTSASTRFSNNTANNVLDDEYIEATLSVSGTELTALSLHNLNIRYTSGRNQNFIDQNGISFNSESGNADWNYSNLTGLAALTKDNVDTWSLAAGLIDGSGSNANDVSAYGQIAFEYAVIPEPATLGLVAVAGVGTMFIRRRLML